MQSRPVTLDPRNPKEALWNVGAGMALQTALRMMTVRASGHEHSPHNYVRVTNVTNA